MTYAAGSESSDDRRVLADQAVKIYPTTTDQLRNVDITRVLHKIVHVMLGKQ